MNQPINITWEVTGNQLPADHNYHLYAAISHQLPQLHHLPGLAIQTIRGIPDQLGKITLTPNSQLKIRLPANHLPLLYPLTNTTLKINQHQIQLKNPQLQTLKPSPILKARLVTIKGYTQAQPFLAAAQRQLTTLNILAQIGIPANKSGQPKRLTLKITKPQRSYTIVGFSLIIRDLNTEDSIKLQTQGMGGKRRIGCGVFDSPTPILNQHHPHHQTP